METVLRVEWYNLACSHWVDTVWELLCRHLHAIRHITQLAVSTLVDWLVCHFAIASRKIKLSLHFAFGIRCWSVADIWWMPLLVNFFADRWWKLVDTCIPSTAWFKFLEVKPTLRVYPLVKYNPWGSSPFCKTSEYQVGLLATRGSLVFSRIVLKVDRTLGEDCLV